ncbi:conserved hypothetical protein [Candidatus Sulfopaludibacter sp. SbA3]|nr:conserved hypothetical protein [Candidatus Sulfopaludibacter sp. SbA3]
MNLNWLANPLVMYGAVAAMGFLSLRLAIAGKIDLRREQRKREADAAGLRETVTALQGLVEELQAEARERAVPQAYAAPSALNLQKRSDALRMYRRGSDRSTIATALGMPPAQVALLEKVHHILDNAS